MYEVRHDLFESHHTSIPVGIHNLLLAPLHLRAAAYAVSNTLPIPIRRVVNLSILIACATRFLWHYNKPPQCLFIRVSSRNRKLSLSASHESILSQSISVCARFLVPH